MPNVVQTNINEYEWHIRGEIDLSAAAAVQANRGTNQTAAKSATGTYTVVVKGSNALKLVEILDRKVSFNGAAAVTGALGCRISGVTQATDGTDDITITLKTTATSGGSGADTDVTAATTLSFQVVIRFAKVSAYP